MRSYVFGAHAYLLSQRGARRLLALSLPVEIHHDFFLLVAGVIGEVTGYLLPRSLVSQCRARVEASIPHFAWRRVNVKQLLPDVPLWTVLVVLTAVVACVACVVRTARGTTAR